MRPFANRPRGIAATAKRTPHNSLIFVQENQAMTSYESLPQGELTLRYSRIRVQPHRLIRAHAAAFHKTSASGAKSIIVNDEKRRRHPVKIMHSSPFVGHELEGG